MLSRGRGAAGFTVRLDTTRTTAAADDILLHLLLNLRYYWIGLDYYYVYIPFIYTSTSLQGNVSCGLVAQQYFTHKQERKRN
jgi:predicted CDP-diglyceride synthetase/phosphatidate cytidylyltransferase